MKNRTFYVYIMTNKRNTVLYTGVTNDLERRVFEHKHKVTGGFTSKYNVTKLVHYEQCDDSLTAIEREKQIKAGSRKKKIALIKETNKDWVDLSEDWFD